MSMEEVKLSLSFDESAFLLQSIDCLARAQGLQVCRSAATLHEKINQATQVAQHNIQLQANAAYAALQEKQAPVDPPHVADDCVPANPPAAVVPIASAKKGDQGKQKNEVI
jgi:hypothetical protein